MPPPLVRRSSSPLALARVMVSRIYACTQACSLEFTLAATNQTEKKNHEPPLRVCRPGAARGRAARRHRADLSDQARTPDRARHHGRAKRHRRAHSRRTAFDRARPAGDHRKQARRIANRRRRLRREGETGRLHAAAGRGQYGNQSDPDAEPALRHGKGLRAGLAHPSHALRIRGERAVEDSVGGRAGEVHPGQSGQGDLRHHRPGQPAGARHLAVRAIAIPARDDGNPVQGQLGGASGFDLEPHRLHDRSAGGVVAAYQVGLVARARGHHAAAQRQLPQRADCDRSGRAGLRFRQLGWRVRAGGDAARHRDEAQ